MGETLDCLGIESTKSHRPEEAFPDSYDKCEPGFIVAQYVTRFIAYIIE